MKLKQTRSGRRLSRKARIRKKVFGTGDCPRMSVFRSNRFLYAQLIDDEASRTLVAASSLKKGERNKNFCNKEAAQSLGTEIANLAKQKKISRVVFDRSGFPYHGVVKTLADSAREAGLVF